MICASAAKECSNGNVGTAVTLVSCSGASHFWLRHSALARAMEAMSAVTAANFICGTCESNGANVASTHPIRYADEGMFTSSRPRRRDTREPSTPSAEGASDHRCS